jgi:23S rRNA (cytosine1962-C5)-methyltransferase
MNGNDRDDYELLDSGDGRKLERFGAVTLARPCSQAMWRPQLPETEWNRASASFDREDGNRWHGRSRLPESWNIVAAGIKFRLSGTDFGHLGIFPEQRAQWKWIRGQCALRAGCRVLNLFAYSGGSTMAAALGGAEVCHLDASRGMVQWARENAALNGLAEHPIRWITDDAHKFLAREARRGREYDAVIFDPPTFGRGANGETYKIERDLKETISLVKGVLSKKPAFVLFSSHTPGLSPVVAAHIMEQSFPSASQVESGEMLLEGAQGVFPCPSGVFARAVWRDAAR